MFIFTSLYALIVALLALLILGLIIGFSPALYVTHISILARSRRPLNQSIAIVMGVISALLILILLSEFLQPDTLRHFLNSFIDQVTNYAWLDYLFGVLFIIFGLFSLLKKNVKSPTAHHANIKVGFATVATLYSFSFIKTFLSVSGFAALLLAVRLIDTTTGLISLQLVLLGVLIVASLIPFVILIFTKMYREKTFHSIQHLFNKMKAHHYHSYAGGLLLIIGIVFICFAVIQ